MLDQTVTALGARLFKDVLLHPTQNMDILHTRQAHIADYTERSSDAKHIQ